MAQSARVHGIADAGHRRYGDGAWLHDLTPIRSDGTLFDVEGVVRPLANPPDVPRLRRPRATLRLVDPSTPAARRS